MQIIQKLLDGRTVSQVLGKNSTDTRQAALAGTAGSITDADEASWTLVGGDTFKVGDKVDKELPRLEQKELRANAYLAYYRNPHARGIIKALVQLTVGSGATLVIDPDLDNRRQSAHQRVWDEFCAENRWRKKQLEIARRTFRDGESILRFLNESVLRFHFLEPDWIDSENPNITHGIKTEADDVSRVKSYRLLNPHTGKEEIIDPAEIQHIKINVDENEKRKRSELEPVLYDLKELQDFRKYRVVMNKIRSAVVMIHKKRGVSPEMQGIIDKNKSTKGNGINKQKLPTAGTRMSIDAESDIEFKSPNLGSADAEIDYRMITLAVASGVSLPEFIVSMDASNNNLASIEKAVVTVAKSIEEKQALLEEEFCRIYERVIKHAVSRGRLPRDASLLPLPSGTKSKDVKDRGANVSQV
jgi:capsid protein